MQASRSKGHWRSLAIVTAAVLMGAGGALLAPSNVEANPTQSIHRAYYNASFTTVVGGKWILKCGGGTSSWGQVTPNYVETRTPCGGGTQPPLELCYVDGIPDICPPGV